MTNVSHHPHADLASLTARARSLLAKIADGIPWTYVGAVSFIRVDSGRAHVCHISNHQSGQRGRYVGEFIAEAPQLVADLCLALEQYEEKDQTRGHSVPGVWHGDLPRRNEGDA